MIATLTNDKLNIENVIKYYTNEQTQFILQQLLVQVWNFFDKNPKPGSSRCGWVVNESD